MSNVGKRLQLCWESDSTKMRLHNGKQGHNDD